MSAKSPPPVHTLIARVCDFRMENFTCSELADLLECNRSSITKAIGKGWLESYGPNMRGDNVKPRYRLEKAAVVLWLWRSTTGNREVIRETLEERAPQILRMIERIESKRAKPAELPPPPKARGTLPPPSNQTEFSF